MLTKPVPPEATTMESVMATASSAALIMGGLLQLQLFVS